MTRRWSPPWFTVFGIATALGCFSALQAYRLTALTSEEWKGGMFWSLLALNLAYWYVPAALTPAIVRVAHRYPLSKSSGLVWRLAPHFAALAAFSVIHVLAMMVVRLAVFPMGGKPEMWTWLSYVQRLYLQNLDWTMMVYCTIVGVTHAATYYTESQQRAIRGAQLETKLVEARLKTLQGQLHPHFLFNTLHTISALLHRDPETADRMISRLSDLLRITLDHSGDQEGPFKEEIEFLQKYLEIEQIRFQDRLTVRFDVSPETLDADAPRFILQPLVENALKHGIGRRRAPGGVVEITARREQHTLWMEVHDNGPGLTASAVDALQKGIGISNTRARLECLFNTDYRFEFSRRGEGLSVRIVIPWSSSLTTAAEPSASKIA